MKQRCSNEKDANYHNYGGRGISVCERWHSFENFLADMGERPSKIHSLDRFPDKNGNYGPDNCRWATPKEQMRNVRYNRMITFNGETYCTAQWAEKLGISAYNIYSRLKRGMSIEQVMSTKLFDPNKFKKTSSIRVYTDDQRKNIAEKLKRLNGEDIKKAKEMRDSGHTLKEIGSAFNISRQSIVKYLNKTHIHNGPTIAYLYP